MGQDTGHGGVKIRVRIRVWVKVKVRVGVMMCARAYDCSEVAELERSVG